MVTAIIPTLNEENRIGFIIDYLKNNKLISEVIVIDDGSVDNTFSIAKERGAKVSFSSMLGKGASMADGLNKAANDYVIYLDGDIYGFDEQLVEKMLAPILNNDADFVKGNFKRKSGRVTELTAKPLIKTFFPELSGFRQPLGGIIASKKEFLSKIKFENDYGVDVGLLIDVKHLGARVVEVDIGSLEHDQQPLEALSKMSVQIVNAILTRASKYKRLHPYALKEAAERERVYAINPESIISKIDFNKKIVLFDMDGTLIEGSYIEHLATYTDKIKALKEYLGRHDIDPIHRTEMIAKTVRGVPKHIFEKIAKTVSLKPTAKSTIVELKKLGFQVGIITDSYFIASEIIRKRVFADFSVAHHLHFINAYSTGSLTISPFMQHPNGCPDHPICKSNFIKHLNDYSNNSSPKIISVGNGQNDTCLFKKSSYSLAIYPQSQSVANSAKKVIENLSESINYARLE
jgi:glucosyl-3-phosphoglycerate synthase